MAADTNISDMTTGSDKVADELLSHVLDHVVSKNLKQFTLRPLKNNEFDIIEQNHQINVKRRIFR